MMGKIKDIEIDLNQSMKTILDHLDVISNDQLSALMDQIGFELMDRDSENLFKLVQAENEYLNGDLILQNGELSA
jgi:hypothetical protein